MSKKTCGVYLTNDEVRVAERIASQRKWTMSKTLAELIRTAPDFRAAMDAMPRGPRKFTNNPAAR